MHTNIADGLREARLALSAREYLSSRRQDKMISEQQQIGTLLLDA